MNIPVELIAVSIIVQLFVIYYSYKLFKIVKPLKYWTKAWGIFTVSMAVVVLRRGWGLYELIQGCPPEKLLRQGVEGGMLIVNSLLWLFFVYKLKYLFTMYLNGQGHLVERENLVGSRENLVGDREDLATKREGDASNREGKLK